MNVIPPQKGINTHTTKTLIHKTKKESRGGGEEKGKGEGKERGLRIHPSASTQSLLRSLEDSVCAWTLVSPLL
jgi:hypothetical protein